MSLPPGKGSFSLALTDGSRTILPTTPNLADFAVYNLTFTPVGNDTFTSVDRTNATLGSSPIILEPGTYNLVVDAYKDGGKSQLMARGTLNNITIAAGSNTSGTVILRALLSEGTGTFRWDIQLPDVFTANMTIVPGFDGGTNQQTVILPLPRAAGDRTLNAGQYTIMVNLEKMDGETLVWHELLYVYQNLESVFSYTFTDAHFVNPLYTVTFDSNGGDIFGSQSVMHGDILESFRTPHRDRYIFGGWYANSTFSGNPWDFNAPIIESFTLYARWDSILVTGIELFRVSETAPPVKMSATELVKIHTGDIITLAADILPANATNQNVIWHSSNPSVVSVNNGILVAQSVGPASITVTSQENYQIMMQCNIRVYHPVSSVIRYQATPSPYTGNDRIRYSFSPDDNDIYIYFIHLGEMAFIPMVTGGIYHHTESGPYTLEVTQTFTETNSIQESVTNNRTQAVSIADSNSKSTTTGERISLELSQKASVGLNFENFGSASVEQGFKETYEASSSITQAFTQSTTNAITTSLSDTVATTTTFTQSYTEKQNFPLTNQTA